MDIDYLICFSCYLYWILAFKDQACTNHLYKCQIYIKYHYYKMNNIFIIIVFQWKQLYKKNREKAWHVDPI
jgi:hypothetical protein